MKKMEYRFNFNTEMMEDKRVTVEGENVASWKDLCQWNAFAYKSNKVSLQRWIYTLGKTQKTSWIKKKIYIHKKKKNDFNIALLFKS